MRVIGAALLLGLISACSDPCDLVIGCTASRRVAVEGRVLTTIGGSPVPETTVRLLATYAGRVDSVETTSDSRGLFHLGLAAPGSDVPQVSLRVMPPGRPGYVLAVGDCKPVEQWGDACVLTPLVSEPSFPVFRFQRRDDGSPVAAARVTFKRTGGATLFASGPGAPGVAIDSVTNVTDSEGFINLFPLEVWAGSLAPVIGNLIVDLPAPTGRVVVSGFQVTPTATFDVRIVTSELVGAAAGPPMEIRSGANGQRILLPMTLQTFGR